MVPHAQLQGIIRYTFLRFVSTCSFVFGGESWAESASAGKPSAKGSLDLSPRSSEATNPGEDGGL